MLKTLKAKNFQSHKDTVLEFSPGITAITGTSDSGKSAIMRALKWVTLNLPRGDGFRSDFRKEDDPTIVELIFDDTKVVRTRSNTVNSYRIDKGKPLKALRSGVPIEVKEALRLTDINIQDQHNPYFLLQGVSASDVASKFNEVSNLESMDLCTDEINRIIRSLKQETTSVDSEIANVLAELEGLEWLEEAEKELAVLEQENNSITEKEEYVDDVSKLYSHGQQLQAKLDAYENLQDIPEIIVELNNLQDSIGKKETHLVAVQQISERYRTTRRKHISVTKKLKDFEDFKELEKIYEEIVEVQNTFDKIVELADKHDSISRDMRAVAHQAEEVEQEFRASLKELKNCPLCDTELDDNIQIHSHK